MCVGGDMWVCLCGVELKSYQKSVGCRLFEASLKMEKLIKQAKAMFFQLINICLHLTVFVVGSSSSRLFF